jgi:hypothetical protein
MQKETAHMIHVAQKLKMVRYTNGVFEEGASKSFFFFFGFI